jgi:uncharacterized protein (TIGR03435 family)
MASVTAWAAFAQPAAAPLSFEVASIKPSAPPLDGRLMVRMGGGPGRLDYTNASLKAIIQRACEVQDYQVSGPLWMASTRFDLAAKLPPGAPGSKVPEMLRSLLAERFKMAVHRETSEQPVYALVVAKNGPKMKVSEADPNSPPPDRGRTTASDGSGAVDCGPRGERPFPAGWMMNKGPGHVQGHSMNMASVVKLLGALVGRPVVDQTGLNGLYDFDLEYAPDEIQRTPPAEAAHDIDGPSLFTAVQSQLGLKLQAGKGPVERIVVDHIEKVPTEN